MAKVIKNKHTAREMAKIADRWAVHEGNYLTLTETLAHAAAQAHENAKEAGTGKVVKPVEEPV